MSFSKGGVVRDRFGDWRLWRVETTYGEDSPFMFGVLVSNHKFHRAGEEQRLLEKERYQVEPDPGGFARSHCFTVDLDIGLNNQGSGS